MSFSSPLLLPTAVSGHAMTLWRSLAPLVAAVGLCLLLLVQLWTSGIGRVSSRRLQFEAMFDNPAAVIVGARGGRKGKGKGKGKAVPRPQALTSYVEDVLLNMDRYHLWWTGPPDQDSLASPAKWSQAREHKANGNAIFTMAIVQGGNDGTICSSPNDFRLFLGSARRVFSGDIVLAVDSGLTAEAQAVINEFGALAYELPAGLCSRASASIFCGSTDERVPASVFRYFFYERWAAKYAATSMVLLADFRDVIFQADPFAYHTHEWHPEYQLLLFQEFHPNMVISRCQFNRRITTECYGQDTLNLLGSRIIISSGAALGTRDAIISWSHHLTLQLQEAPGRLEETRCVSGGIDHAFINWLSYNNKLRHLMRVKVFSQGEGAVNTVGGLRPNTVTPNITGDIKSFWRLLDDSRHVLNWNGDVSPVVHQLDHFLPELEALVDAELSSGSLKLASRQDRGWHAVASSRCLWGCKG